MRICSNSYSQASVEQWNSEAKVASARRSYEQTHVAVVEPAEGNPAVPYSFEMPDWLQMEEALVVPAVAT